MNLGLIIFMLCVEEMIWQIDLQLQSVDLLQEERILCLKLASRKLGTLLKIMHS